ncbi:phospho-N-acetylmuramoyl-pentapeptide-transferase [Candidatus Gracilibacteria bacterium]|nr:MAG: phospho-N-acetylmuramoyl-pentapeptide-transferase [Candidatus Gracilibacteria bacterium]PIE85200.1 MAG: phospho-N-acetylmuramoyl-pentapeptide-transferase [Candidatus Gracilibacteria bacterium]
MNTHIILIFSFGISTFLFGFLFIPYYIKYLKEYKIGKQIREDASIGKAIEFFKLHKKKIGTPTMGGVMILFTVFFMVFISIILQGFGLINNSLLNSNETYLPLFTLLTVGFLGAIDDIMNIKGIGKTKGLSAKFKMLWLLVFAFLGSLWFYFNLGWDEVDNLGNYVRTISNPFGENIQAGIFFIPLFIFIIVASANSVNIADGLDGLCGGLLLFAYSIYAYITYDQGLFLLSTLCTSIVGALIAFLWYNVKPAKFYMGDVGSLALGANLGLIAMLTNTIFVFLIVSSIFIFESLSVIIQLTSKKLRKGKKVFIIAPFHHHLEAIGWTEENVVFRMWLIGLLTSVFGIIFYILQK